MEKKGKHGMEITTNERVWSFLCQSESDRNEWFNCIQLHCLGIQPQVQYVQQPKVQYVQQPPPQYAQPQQPMYRGSVIQQPSKVQPQQITRPQSQSLQPGMIGYNVGNMYGGNEEKKENDNQWEDTVPPPAYASAPPENDVIPSAPPQEEQEGAYTGQ